MITPARFRWFTVLLAGYIFYGSVNPLYLLFLIIPTAVVYLAGRGLSGPKKRIVLFGGIVLPLGLLFIFKYLDLFYLTFGPLFSGAGIKPLNLIFPVGISFYSFRLVSYIVDVYRGKISPEKHPGHFALYVSFFPQLLAGPIDRAGNLLPQIRSKLNVSWEGFTGGLRLVLWGIFKKIVIADRMGIYVNEVFGSPSDFSGLQLLFGVYFFSFQIYCDFSGYTDIAIGLSKMFGIRSMENFNFPYVSRNLKDFWNRWHISLSTWLRDYVFISVAYPVMRIFKKERFAGMKITSIGYISAIFVTMLIGGLWHGANWTFVIWGTLHGIYLVIGHLTEKPRKKLRKKTGLNKAAGLRNLLQVFITFNLVSLAWVFFRADSFSQAVEYIRNIGFSLPETGIPNLVYTLLFFIVFLISDFIYKQTLERGWFLRVPTELKLAGYALALVLIIVFSVDSSNEFIYFNF